MRMRAACQRKRRKRRPHSPQRQDRSIAYRHRSKKLRVSTLLKSIDRQWGQCAGDSSIAGIQLREAGNRIFTSTGWRRSKLPRALEDRRIWRLPTCISRPLPDPVACPFQSMRAIWPGRRRFDHQALYSYVFDRHRHENGGGLDRMKPVFASPPLHRFPFRGAKLRVKPHVLAGKR